MVTAARAATGPVIRSWAYGGREKPTTVSHPITPRTGAASGSATAEMDEHHRRGQDEDPGGRQPAAQPGGERAGHQQRGEAGGQREVGGQPARGTVTVHRVQLRPSGAPQELIFTPP